MAKKIFLTDIDLAQNELQNGVIQNLATAPTSPKPGQLYYNTSSSRPYFWDSSTWSLFGHTDSEINSLVRGALLSGYTKGANSALTASDSVLGAFGKVQAQIDAIPRGTVTSVGLTAPTGLTVSGSPITGSGTLALSFTSGYSIPTTTKQGQWDTAYTQRHTHTNKTVLDGITSTLVSNWNKAYTNNHTHANKLIIDKLTQGDIDVLRKLSVDEDGSIKVDATLWATGGVSALGLGEGGGSSGGGGVDMLDSWANYTVEKADFYAPASLLVPFRSDTLSRLTSLESGSATSITTTGSGNAITSISKSGNVITATKGTKFAELGTDGFILTSQLPSYVDDVLEFTTLANFPTTGESGKIYVATGTNITYRWTGTTYVEISKSIALGTTSSTAYRGDRGLIAYNHSQAAHQTIINGTGFVKASGTTLSYDNSSYALSSHNHSGVYQPLHTGLTNIATQSANATKGLLKKTAANTWTFDTNTYSLSSHTHSGVYEPVFTKNGAFNKNFGTTSGTVAQGNDSRFTNARTPTKKTGAIGTGLTTSVTHGLGSANVIAQVMTTAGEVVECNIVNTSTTTTFSFNVAPAANTYKYVIIG